MPITGRTMMTTSHAIREAGSRCGRKMTRAITARWTRKKAPVHSAVRTSLLVIQWRKVVSSGAEHLRFCRAHVFRCYRLIRRNPRRFLIHHESRTEDNQDSKDHFCCPLNKRNDTKISCILSWSLECFVGKPPVSAEVRLL